jgi:hypothetical protein
LSSEDEVFDEEDLFFYDGGDELWDDSVDYEEV